MLFKALFTTGYKTHHFGRGFYRLFLLVGDLPSAGLAYLGVLPQGIMGTHGVESRSISQQGAGVLARALWWSGSPVLTSLPKMGVHLAPETSSGALRRDLCSLPISSLPCTHSPDSFSPSVSLTHLPCISPCRCPPHMRPHLNAQGSDKSETVAALEKVTVW